jgi:hypothetical protein
MKHVRCVAKQHEHRCDAVNGSKTSRRHLVIAELQAFLIRERAAFEVRDADGRCFAKVMAPRDGDLYALAVLPAVSSLDLSGFRRRIRRYALTVANEDEFRGQFPSWLEALCYRSGACSGSLYTSITASPRRP